MAIKSQLKTRYLSHDNLYNAVRSFLRPGDLNLSRSVLVLFGSGPGIGISVAKAFARQYFEVIALCSRDAKRLQSEQAEVEAAAKQAEREVQVVVFPTDLTDLKQLERTLNAVQALGPLGCVYHNAARINYEQPLTTSPKDVEEDFRVRYRTLSACRVER